MSLGPDDLRPDVPNMAAPRPVVLAGFWVRTAAYAVDSLALGLVGLASAMVLGRLDWSRVPPDPRWGTLDQLVDTINDQPVAVAWFVLGFAVAQVIYGTFFESLAGRTPGKQIFRLAVIHSSGRAPSVVCGLVRNCCKVGSVLGAGLGALWAAFATERRAFHDHVADTYVIKS